jgi:2-(1,2-epoxy-1,2-dihydrophenyl)acetyl-CoA isomerase
MTEAVRHDLDEGVLTLTMNWPDRLNVLGGGMVDALGAGFARAAAEKSVRCVVLEGAGKHFCAGGDISLMKDWVAREPEVRKREFHAFIERFHVVVRAMQALPKPVIGSLHGAVAGAGLSLAMGCDLAVASDDAVFTLAYIKIATSPDGGATWWLPRHVGVKKAMEIAMLGDRFDAATALTLGLVNRVVPAVERMTETKALARRLADGPTAALGHTKALIHAASARMLDAQLRDETERFARNSASDDFSEGLAAFLAKRPPSYRGS